MLALKCLCSPDYVARGPLWFSTVLFLNTSVTSRLVPTQAGAPAMSEALIYEVGRHGVAQVHQGIVTGNSVIFGQISLDGIRPGETRTFKIMNLRCNATVTNKILAAVSLGGLPVENDTPPVAVGSKALNFEVSYPGQGPRADPFAWAVVVCTGGVFTV